MAIWGSAVFVTLVSLYNPLNSPVGDIKVATFIFSLQSVVMKISDMNWNTKIVLKDKQYWSVFNNKAKKRESKGSGLHTSRHTSTKLQPHGRHICLLKWEVTQIKPVLSFFWPCFENQFNEKPKYCSHSPFALDTKFESHRGTVFTQPKKKKAARQVTW